MASVQGHIDPRFNSVRDLLSSNIANGTELGASLTVTINGETVIDIWGGHADPSHLRPWDRDTIVNAWSSTKAIASLAIMVLVDRGLINLDSPVAKYWPEFGANGKETVTVRNIISHTSGVAAWDPPFVTEDMYDFDASTARLAAQSPWWTPGSQSGYHALTHGHLIGAVVRRVTGKTLKQFVADELAGPLHADFQIGAKRDDDARIATIVAPPPLAWTIEPGSMPARILGGPAVDANTVNTVAWRDAEIGSANGHTNGRGLARMMEPLAMGGTVDGVKLLSTTTTDEIFKVQGDGPDLALMFNVKFGTGFGLPAKNGIWSWVPDQGRICGWGGWGGSMAIADLDRRMSIGYAMNKMQEGILGSVCSMAYIQEIYKVLGVTV